MSALASLWHRLANWFAEAVPAVASEPRDRDPVRDAEAEEAHRASIHDVTLEQLGLAHWSCHTLF